MKLSTVHNGLLILVSTKSFHCKRLSILYMHVAYDILHKRRSHLYPARNCTRLIDPRGVKGWTDLTRYGHYFGECWCWRRIESPSLRGEDRIIQYDSVQPKSPRYITIIGPFYAAQTKNYPTTAPPSLPKSLLQAAYLPAKINCLIRPRWSYFNDGERMRLPSLSWLIESCAVRNLSIPADLHMFWRYVSS